METTLIYGAGAMGKHLFPKIESEHGLGQIFFVDSNPALWGTTFFDKEIISPNSIPAMEYDRIILSSLQGYETIPIRLNTQFSVPNEKIDKTYLQELFSRTFDARNRFLNRFAEIVYTRSLNGSVAEGGVFEGYFARQINREFPDRKLYLFDTFSGFDERDVFIEEGDTQNRAKHYNANITESELLESMPNPSNIVIRKGYFPDTAVGIDDIFIFVNLDFDLYNPTLSGLEFFYPKMVSNGVILVHDYFYDAVMPNKEIAFQGVRPAVEKFCNEQNISFVPVADEMSIAIIKN